MALKPTPAPPKRLTGLILDSITEGVFTVDPNMRISSFNRAAQKITGLTAAQALGRKCHEVFRADICGTTCPLQKSMATGEPGLEVDLEITRADDVQMPVRIRTTVLRDAGGEVVGGVETFRDLSEMHHLLKRLTEGYTFCDLKGKSEPMRQLFEVLPEVATSGATVLISGESGTGKELVARALHDLSPRSEGPFVAVNCAAIPEGLLESELFGHVRGAFTGADRQREGRFAAAEGGTLFLDEIGDLPAALQVKLLRVLDAGEYTPLGSNRTRQSDARLVTATNRDLEQEIQQGRFREDLFYRLNVVGLMLPPLRERREDIPLLVDYFLERLAAERGEPLRRLTPAAMSRLLDHRWPGNVRELQNAVEHALVLAQGGAIEPRHLPQSLRRLERTGRGTLSSRLDLHSREKEAITKALALHEGHRARAAAELGISTTTLWRKMKRYGIMP